MKKYICVLCATLFLSHHAMADEFNDLRHSSENMTKEQAKNVEAGALPLAAYSAYGYYAGVVAPVVARYAPRLANPGPIGPAIKQMWDSRGSLRPNLPPPTPNYTGAGSVSPSRFNGR